MNNIGPPSIGSKIRRVMTHWLLPLYKWVGVGYPKASLVTMFLVGGLIFGGMWYLTGREYQESLKKSSPIGPQIQPQGSTGIVVKDKGKYEGIDTRINGVQEGIRVEGSGQAKTYGGEISGPGNPSKPRTVQEQINSFIISSDEARKSKFDLDGWTAVVSNFLDQSVGPRESKEFIGQPTLGKKVKFLKKLKGSLPKK